MFPRFFYLSSIELGKNITRNKIPSLQIHIIRTVSTSHYFASGISTGSVTKLPSGLTGMEELIEGQNLFAVQEGMAKIFFPASTPEEVFYNPGKFHGSR